MNYGSGLVGVEVGSDRFWGAKVAHIAMLHDEVVNRRKWLDEKHFLDLLGRDESDSRP